MSQVYAEVGFGFQQVGGSCPAGWVVMQSERPTPDHVANADGTWSLDLDAVKTQRIAAINAEAQRLADAYTAEYPEFERMSWRDQEAQALAHLADPDAETPMLATMAAIRGITVTDLANRVVANAATFREEGAKLMGLRQALEEQIAAATTVEQVLAVQWPEDTP